MQEGGIDDKSRQNSGRIAARWRMPAPHHGHLQAPRVRESRRACDRVLKTDECHDENRVDRRNLEPCSWVREDQPRM
jgi:hypothetical protein